MTQSRMTVERFARTPACLNKAFNMFPSFFVCSVVFYNRILHIAARLNLWQKHKTSRGPKCIPLKHVHMAKLTHTIIWWFSFCALIFSNDEQHKFKAKWLENTLGRAIEGNMWLLFEAFLYENHWNYIHSFLSLSSSHCEQCNSFFFLLLFLLYFASSPSVMEMHSMSPACDVSKNRLHISKEVCMAPLAGNDGW